MIINFQNSGEVLPIQEHISLVGRMKGEMQRESLWAPGETCESRVPRSANAGICFYFGAAPQQQQR